MEKFLIVLFGVASALFVGNAAVGMVQGAFDRVNVQLVANVER